MNEWLDGSTYGKKMTFRRLSDSLVSQPAAAVASTMKPTVIWLASFLALSVSMAFVDSTGPPRPPSGLRWLKSWFPASADYLRPTRTGFQKKHNPLVHLKKGMDVLRLKKDSGTNKRDMDVLRLKRDRGNSKRNMDVLRLKKSILKGRNSKNR